MKEKNIGYISTLGITEQFKGEVADKIIKWPKELGVEHPFNFEDCEKVFVTFGLINGVINKITDNIVGEFIVRSDNTLVSEAVRNFIKKNNFSIVLREWIREALTKGNGFMEVNTKTGDCRVINANDMYVVRNKKGEVIGYNQYIGDYEKFNSKKIIPFKPEQIAHLSLNSVSGEAYGRGLIIVNENAIQNFILNQKDQHFLIKRKAGAPIHVKMGQPGESVAPTHIDAMSNNLRYMNNKTEWVTDGNVEIKVIDFGPIGDNVTKVMESDLKEIIAGIDIPEVMLNSGQLNEGIAKVQLESWQRRIISYQDLIEAVIVSKIFNPYLLVQGLKGEVDFIWNLPSESEVNNRLIQLNTLLGNMSTTENMKRMLQLEIARLLNLKDADLYLPLPEKGLDEKAFQDKQDINLNKAGLKPEVASPIDNEKEKEKKQPVAKFPQAHDCTIHENIDFSSMNLKDFIELREANGFNYSDYLVAILKRIKTDKFSDLKAITEADIQNGLLTESEISKLRTILKEGFRRNQAMQVIENNIRESLSLKDRIKEDGSIIAASSRPEMIARSEVVRLANEGLKDLFKENNIKNVSWVATYSERTCENCMAMDGKVYPITEAIGDKIPPLHPMCRCSLVSA